MRGILFFIVLALNSQLGRTQQVIPADGAVITRTSVLFEVPEVVGATTYKYSIKSSEGNVIDVSDMNHVLLIEGLSFGESYSWSVTALDEVGKTLRVYRQQFEIGTSEFIDPKESRFRVVGSGSNSELDGLIILDYNRVAIRPDGTPVWFLPEKEVLNDKRLRDLELTNRGTVTYLDILNCEELSLDGDVLWRTPSTGKFSGDTSDYYHHEFTRLSNGNYLVLGKQYVASDLAINEKPIEKLPLSIIIEYSPEGEVVWTWSSDEYVKDEDILSVGQKVGMGNTFGHMNSAYFDEATGIVYVGFRDLNCILALDKKSGKVVQSYGDKIPSDKTIQGIGFFKKQHAPIKLSGDRLLLFNNNDRDKTSTVQIISEVTAENPTAEILWEFSCDFDTLMPSSSPRMGNALPLDEGHVLVNMGKTARIFEVTPEKEVVWQCFPEIWDGGLKIWRPQSNYRVCHISSLYPYYHTVSFRDGKIQVSNEGSEIDVYSVLIYKKPRKRKKAKELVLNPDSGQSVDIQLKNVFKRKIRSKTIFVEVRSKNNPDLVVERSYLMR